MMQIRFLLAMVIGLLLTPLGAVSAHALCGTISATATGLSEVDAMKAANNRGLVEVRRLNQKYGNVQYQPAKWRCTGASHVRCVISQKYCVADRKPNWPKCKANEQPAMNDAGCVCKSGYVRVAGECMTKAASEPWKSPSCKAAQRACGQGIRSACLRQESVCNVN